jgi:IS5 family transposase
MLKIRRLLVSNALGARLFAKLGEALRGQGLLGTGTMVEATIIGAPSSEFHEEKGVRPRDALAPIHYVLVFHI